MNCSTPAPMISEVYTLCRGNLKDLRFTGYLVCEKTKNNGVIRIYKTVGGPWIYWEWTFDTITRQNSYTTYTAKTLKGLGELAGFSWDQKEAFETAGLVRVEEVG